LSKQTNNIVANKICVVSKIGLGTGIFGKMAVKGLTAQYLHYNYGNWLQITDFSEYASLFFMQKTA